MSQLTLVAHYGPKQHPHQAAFTAYARACQQAVSQSGLGQRFTPYQEAQLHGTLIGLEHVNGQPGADPSAFAEVRLLSKVELLLGLYNANYWTQTGRLQAMDLDCALALARSLPPLTIRFGGFHPEDRVITSRGQSAYARSFGIDWRTGKVVIMGWVHEDGDFFGYTKLWTIRRTFAERCHVHHKYENDSDFFVTIGELTGLDGLDATALAGLRDAGEKVEKTLRSKLADPRNGVDLPLRTEDLSVVCYMNESLDPVGSQAFAVVDPNLNAAALWRVLYG